MIYMGTRMTADRQALRGWTAFHPFLWAAQPVLFLYARAVHEISPVKVLAPLAVSLTAAAVLWALAFLALRRDPAKGACLASIMILLFFSFGRIVQVAEDVILSVGLWPQLTGMHAATQTLSLQTAVLSACVLLLVAAVLRLRRRRPISPRTTPLMGWTAAALLLVSCGQIGLGLLSSPPAGVPAKERIVAGPDSRADRPDIYIIVADGYARSDVLRDFYGFDNSPFLQALEGLGFSVASKSSANYPWTFLSLSSTLNMTPLTDLVKAAGRRSRDQRRPQEMIRDNAVLAFLGSRGYRSVHLASVWTATRNNPHADVNIAGRGHVMDDDLMRALADTSLLTLFGAGLSKDLALFHLGQLRDLEDQADGPGPKMVFAHIMLPHPPYLFRRDGRIAPQGSFMDHLVFRKAHWHTVDGYNQQLEFLNGKLLALFRTILSSSRVPPIIVLFSDHGPFVDPSNEEHVQRARLANLTAAFLPGAPPDLLPEDVRLINLFPIILNHYFGTAFERSARDRFFSTYRRPYDLEPVGPDPSPFAFGTPIEPGSGGNRQARSKGTLRREGRLHPWPGENPQGLRSP